MIMMIRMIRATPTATPTATGMLIGRVDSSSGRVGCDVGAEGRIEVCVSRGMKLTVCQELT